MKDTLPSYWVYVTFYAELVGDEHLKTVHHPWQDKPHTYREHVCLNWVIFGSKADAKAIETIAFEQARQRHLKETGRDTTLGKTNYYTNNYKRDSRKLIREGRFTDAGPIVNADLIKMLDGRMPGAVHD